MEVRDPTCDAANFVRPQRRPPADTVRPPAAPQPSTRKGPDIAAPKAKPSWVDPQREAKLLKGRMERALAQRTQDSAKWKGATPGCREVVAQIAHEHPGLHSLRAERRAQARERMGSLSKAFEERGC